MFNPQLSSTTHLNTYGLTWQEFNCIVGALHRQQELQGLMDWATRKKLSGPKQFYMSRLHDEETRLFRYRCRSPRLFAVARLARWVNGIVSGEPRYYGGYAVKYPFVHLIRRP